MSIPVSSFAAFLSKPSWECGGKKSRNLHAADIQHCPLLFDPISIWKTQPRRSQDLGYSTPFATLRLV